MSTPIDRQPEQLKRQMPSRLEISDPTGDFLLLLPVANLAQKSKTYAMTPDKMDRLSGRTEEAQKEEGMDGPYPLTEEEATPEVPRSEEILSV